MKITPQCRYNHGELIRITNNGKVPEWSLHQPGHEASHQFQVGVFVCKECGYVELFDMDIEDTLKGEGVK